MNKSQRLKDRKRKQEVISFVKPPPMRKVKDPVKLDNLRATTDEEGQIYCREAIPDIAGTYSGLVKVVGGGRDMWDDWERAKKFEGDVMCVNVAGMFIPHPVKHLFSWHCRQLFHIKGWRKAEIPDDQALTHSTRDFPGIDYAWYLSGTTSVSGLSAAELCFLMGYEKIILIGVPMDNSGYFYKPTVNRDFFDKWRQREVRGVWDRVKKKVRSMSGYTKEIYGEPPADW